MNKQLYNLLFNGRFKYGQVKGSSGFYDKAELTADNCEFIDKIPADAVKLFYWGGSIILYTDAEKTIHINTDAKKSDMVADAVEFIKAQNVNSQVVEYSGGIIYAGGRSGNDNLKKLVL